MTTSCARTAGAQSRSHTPQAPFCAPAPGATCPVAKTPRGPAAATAHSARSSPAAHGQSSSGSVPAFPFPRHVCAPVLPTLRARLGAAARRAPPRPADRAAARAAAALLAPGARRA
eukprot:scaffold3768_cov376-Prasinococcus_capsulatus_cf.AAC.11